MRSGVGLGTSESAQGPGWLATEHPKKLGSEVNAQPSITDLVLVVRE
jgi:hypothetical protein